MKKFFTLLCFILGLGCMGIAVYTAGMEDPLETQTYIYEMKDPKRLADVSMEDYVSLPIIEGMQIKEDKKEDYADIKKEAMDMLYQSAQSLQNVKEKECTVIADCTVSQGSEFLTRLNDVYFGIGNKSVPEELEKSLIGATVGDSITLGAIDFMEYEGVNLNLTIKSAYAIPYPVTDDYMKKNTEYTSFDDMINSMKKNRTEQDRTEKRNETMNNLIEEVLKKSTFIELPSSLCEKELEFLQKEDPSVQYEDALNSLKRIFFISAVIKNGELATESDMNTRLEQYVKESQEELSDYEKDRMKYLLYTDEVTNYLYKNVKIIETAENAEESSRQTNNIGQE